MTANGQTAISRDGERRRIEAARVESDSRRKARVEVAKRFCRPFAGSHLDVAAMSYLLLEWENGAVPSREQVKARVRASYPWIGVAA